MSDLITTLGILHDHLMREATSAKHKVSVSFNPNAQSLQHSITMVWPQLEKQRTLKKNYHLLEGLQVGFIRGEGEEGGEGRREGRGGGRRERREGRCVWGGAPGGGR